MKILIICISFLLSLTGYAQIKNVNPNPDGEPWIAGGLNIPSETEINAIPLLKLKDGYNNIKTLPVSLDNSTNIYFRPVFNQTDGCCAQASGVAYCFTYEINRLRGTNASLSENQFPTHYTYNFLNGGDGANGSWMSDGWDIIKANGCPTISTYGDIANLSNYWMSGYDNYTSGMNNRVEEIVAIDVSTEEGLETLKYWMFNHLDNSETGGVVTFAAGIYTDGYAEDGYKIVSWGSLVNHAMTIVGWDDNIEYDFNNDGQITNSIDINEDGVVDLRDWEKGAVIMVNSWGSSWMNGGKAYIMYKLLAEDVSNGGIHSQKVFTVKVKETQEPQLLMKVRMQHNSRNKIKVSAGISPNISNTEPEFELDFPLFNYQGGDYDMRGFSTEPIDFVLDISPLLSYTATNETAKYFLKITENDVYNLGSGSVIDFSIIDANGNETVCSNHNVNITDNGITLLSLQTDVSFNAPVVVTSSLPAGNAASSYSHQMEAAGGSAPYKWKILIDYNQQNFSENYPSINSEQLIPTNNDDGYVTKILDFQFPFYGEYYNEITVSTDGALLFEPGFDYLRNEEAIKSHKMIGVFASDLLIDPAMSEGIFYEGDANSATIRWKTELWGDTAAVIDVAVKLFPSGEIKFFYGSNLTQNLSWASGVSNGNGSYLISNISGMSDPSNSRVVMNSAPFPNGMFIDTYGLFQGVTPSIPGTWDINFAVTDNNNISEIKTLSFTTGVADIAKINTVNNVICYPNPFTESINFEILSDNNTNAEIIITDISGRHLYSENIILIKNEKKIIKWQMNRKIPSGIYFYQIKIGENSLKYGKLVKSE